MSKRYLYTSAILIACAMSLAGWIAVHADQPPIPHDYIQEVGNKFVFVMLTTDDPSIYAMDIQDKNVRSKYSQSGLYAKDNSLQPLWTVDWYAFQVDVSLDGKYMVRWGEWPIISNYDVMAFSIYENGQEIRRYDVDALVAFPALLPGTTSHYEWKKDSSFDDEQKKLWVSTLNGEEYIFDITTGEIVKGTRAETRRLFIFSSIAVIVVLIVFAGVTLFRRFKNEKRGSNNTPPDPVCTQWHRVERKRLDQGRHRVMLTVAQVCTN